MSAPNPYASTPSKPSANGSAHREGAVLVVGEGAALPDRCVQCNAPGAHRKTYKFTWHKPWLYALLVASPILYAIVAMLARRSISIEASLCESHRSKRIRGGIILATGVALGIGLLLSGGAQESALLALLGILVFLAGLIAGMVHLRFLTPELIEDGTGRFKGCSSAFLDSLGGEPTASGK